MLETLDVQGFRAISRLELAGLGRVNLLVGRNNCGKTSVLEALYIALSQNQLTAMSHVCTLRGEHRPVALDKGDLIMEINHFFHGNQACPGTRFRIASRDITGTRFLSATVNEPDEKVEHEFLQAVDPGMDLVSTMSRRLMLSFESNDSARNHQVGFDVDGSLSLRRAYYFQRLRINVPFESSSNVRLMATDQSHRDELLQIWDKIQLTEWEADVLDAMRIIDPSIEQLRAVGTKSTAPHGGSFIVKLAGQKHPVPLGNLGDGVRRLLRIALSLSQCAGGTLLIDEIDTGLHHSTMAGMWKLIFETAIKLDIQVFATTHSLDCVHSLASICNPDSHAEDSVTIQRIERGRPTAIRFSGDQIRIVAEQQFEIR